MASDDMKRRIRERLSRIDAQSPDFDVLTDLVDQQLDLTAGGFVEFGRFTRFQQGPGYPPSPEDPPVPSAPKEL